MCQRAKDRAGLAQSMDSPSVASGIIWEVPHFVRVCSAHPPTRAIPIGCSAYRGHGLFGVPPWGGFDSSPVSRPYIKGNRTMRNFQYAVKVNILPGNISGEGQCLFYFSVFLKRRKAHMPFRQ